jgi:hypothetical protein
MRGKSSFLIKEKRTVSLTWEARGSMQVRTDLSALITYFTHTCALMVVGIYSLWVYFFFFCFWDNISLSLLGWHQICYPIALISWVLGLQTCTTMLGSLQILLKSFSYSSC